MAELTRRTIPVQIDDETFEKTMSELNKRGIVLSDAVNSFLQKIALYAGTEGFTVDRAMVNSMSFQNVDPTNSDSVLNSSPIFVIRLKGREGSYRVVYANEKLPEFTPNKSLADVQAHYDKFGLGVYLMDREQENIAGIISSLTKVGQTNIAESRVATPTVTRNGCDACARLSP